MVNHKSQIINQKSQKSWHHRIARLIADAYDAKCGAANCQRAAKYVCEWDQIRGIRAVSGCKLYCAHHACNFAAKHGIYMADLPDVKLSELETASRDDWKYSDDKDIHHEGHEEREANSQSSIVNSQSREER